MQSYQQPQQPYLAPPQPIQPNQIEQAGQLIDLLDKLNQRRSSGGIEPGQTGTNFNLAQFQSNPQLLQMQELLLRNPQLLGQLQQPQQQQTQGQAQQNSQQQIEKLQRENQALKYASHHANEYNKKLSTHAQIGGLGQIAVNGLTEQLDHATNMALVGGEALTLLSPLIEQVYQQEVMINIQGQMLTNPWYLLHHCFEVWFQTVTAENTGFIDLLSEAYMKFVEAFENSHKSSYGKYSDTYTQYLNAQANQPPPELVQQQQQNASMYQNLARAMQEPGIGAKMQQQHSMMRQMQNMQR